MNNPIGIFDSGIGGTSIWKEIHTLLPYENTIYLADSVNAPYGYKSEEEIILLSKKNTKLLVEMGCKLVVVACNTATTNAISTLRKQFNIPFIGIEPAIKPASLQTQSKSIGILATKGTLNSSLFSTISKKFTNNITLIEVIGEGLVPLIEAGNINSEDVTSLLKKYIQPMLTANIDYLVLGCSHYPYLIPQIKKIIPKEITIIDSGEAVARQTKKILLQNNLLSNCKEKPSLHFYSNSDIRTLQQFLKEYSKFILVKKKKF